MDILCFRLCETIGVIHPDFLPDELTADHLVDWANYWAGQNTDVGLPLAGPTSEEMRQTKILNAIKIAKGANGKRQH